MNNIDEKTVLNFYLKEMEKGNIDFLQKNKGLKSEIKDCIIGLRNSKNMNEKIDNAKKLWKLLFEASMSYIDPDKSGYDKLFKYFDEYVNFEELIFASDSFYRDHTLHCLWVYFLEEYLKRNTEFEPMFKNYQKYFTDLLKMKEMFEKSSVKAPLNDFINVLNLLGIDSYINDYMSAIYCVSALTHDLGYPIKKISKINKSIGKILPYFSVADYSEFDFSYSSIQKGFIENFISFISTNISFSSKNLNGNDGKLVDSIFVTDESDNVIAINEENVKKLTPKQLDRLQNLIVLKPNLKGNISRRINYWNDFENYEHGIMSAFLLMKIIKSFTNVKFNYKDNYNINLGDIDFQNYLVKSSILKAVTNHTSKGYQLTGIYELSDILIFIDELEEFSRTSRANMNRQFVQEFCKTSLYMKDGYFNIDFIFDNDKLENLDPEISFKGKCERFLTLFDIKSLDKDFKIRLRCIGKLPSNNNTYTLEISRKYAEISINGEEKSIPDYLNSRQFYTSKMYQNL